MTIPDDILAHNRQLIEQFRADGGVSMGNRPLLLLTTTGARTGQQRTSPMMYVHNDGRLLVIASNNGGQRHPAWFHNLVAEPTVTVEVPGETYQASAVALAGDDYDEQWAQITAKFPFFVEHQAKAGARTIPLVALTRL